MAVTTLAGHVWNRMRGPVERLANHVVLLRVGPVIFVTYGAFVATGAALAQLTAGALLARDGMAHSTISFYLATASLAAAIGARVTWLAAATIQATGPNVTGNLRRVGFVSWGAYLGLTATTLAMASMDSTNAVWLADHIVLPALICAAVGRIGCLTYGCCYGRPSPAGIRWTNPDAKVRRELDEQPVSRVPTPLLSSLASTATLVVAGALTHHPVPAGTVTAVAVLLYGLGRFATDALRDRANQLHGTHLSSGQVNGLALAGMAALALLVLDGPPAWTAPATALRWAAVEPLLPTVAVTTAVVFVVAGFHWRQVGSW